MPAHGSPSAVTARTDADSRSAFECLGDLSEIAAMKAITGIADSQIASGPAT
jgi:hypothetical protein